MSIPFTTQYGFKRFINLYYLFRKRGQIQLVLPHVESHATASVQQQNAFRIRDDAEQSICRGEFSPFGSLSAFTFDF